MHELMESSEVLSVYLWSKAGSSQVGMHLALWWELGEIFLGISSY